MGWDELLPIAALVLGFGLSQVGESFRDRRERERIFVQQQVDIQTAALVDLQDVLWTLPPKFNRVASLAEDIRRINVSGETLTGDLAGEWTDSLIEATQQRTRARVLASRIGDNDLRVQTLGAIETAAASDVLDGEELVRSTPVVYPRANAWHVVEVAAEAIGGHLRPRLRR